MPNKLTPGERRALQARAHALDPVVLIGDDGLNAAVLAEIDRSLNAHELIKVRVTGENKAARETILRVICEQLGAAAVQHIGKTLVVFRKAPEGKPKNPGRRKRKPPRALKRSFQHR